MPNHRGEGLFEYKGKVVLPHCLDFMLIIHVIKVTLILTVYGTYDDITAVDFLAVHVDTEFRREWDTSAVVLDVLESESQSNSEVVYWEMQWPVSFHQLILYNC